jgi:hypothetical protein
MVPLPQNFPESYNADWLHCYREARARARPRHVTLLAPTSSIIEEQQKSKVERRKNKHA